MLRNETRAMACDDGAITALSSVGGESVP